MERRSFLLVTMGAGVAGLAGCTGGGDGNGGGGTDEPNDSDGTPSEDNDDGSSGAGGDELGDIVRWDDSFIADVTTEDSGTESAEATYRFNGANAHVTVRGEEQADIYSVGEDVYVVTGGQCIVNPGESPAPDPGIEFQDREGFVGGQPDLTPAGTDTIDGEEVFVYELVETSDVATLYVSRDTGYIRRAEYGNGVIDYRFWGEVDPIEPPDMNCQDIGAGDY
jgi:hypothetical protein